MRETLSVCLNLWGENRKSRDYSDLQTKDGWMQINNYARII